MVDAYWLRLWHLIPGTTSKSLVIGCLIKSKFSSDHGKGHCEDDVQVSLNSLCEACKYFGVIHAGDICSSAFLIRASGQSKVAKGQHLQTAAIGNCEKVGNSLIYSLIHRGAWIKAVCSSPSKSPGTSPDASSAFIRSMNAGPNASLARMPRFCESQTLRVRSVGLVEDEGDLFTLDPGTSPGSTPEPHPDAPGCTRMHPSKEKRCRMPNVAQARFMTIRTSASKARTS